LTLPRRKPGDSTIHRPEPTISNAPGLPRSPGAFSSHTRRGGSGVSHPTENKKAAWLSRHLFTRTEYEKGLEPTGSEEPTGSSPKERQLHKVRGSTSPSRALPEIVETGGEYLTSVRREAERLERIPVPKGCATGSQVVSVTVCVRHGSCPSRFASADGDAQKTPVLPEALHLLR
jgi:hypothetical protein